ncbi:Bug family tripartite tricarboxylate transporter substrate binding protein, partial [Orrella sp. 11846]|uniref:Bug family tripartite tricarboxylate transporter substrate binding protein n=1 Tax=Orrella sp. 11846 TaxID=3409913 RepID=UPI003B5B37CF
LMTGTTTLAAQNEAYPNKPVKVIVPIAPGGSSDTIARIVSDKLRETWDSPVIVENMAGAGGTIGASKGAHATPDGYTLVAHGDAVVLNPIVRKNSNYELNDFIGVNRFVVNPQVLVVHPDFGPKTLDEYVQFAKKSTR